ncbi:STN domain-containing protein [Luteibacter aegosomatissinici]|uniref:STN domain-containing protein n=1 Tax=Luteibacter aegosomatissinici TaxID=2911539 RepID=UPI001FF8F77E|nr:STN domain-containing protein [Luteibacter aegosomatissinici]UPG92959.1 STN domain-containing protein [Luteibacter aegosomatissinici]
MTRCVLALLACVLCFGTVQAAPWGGDTTPGITHGPTRFDIDAQPLAGALRAFSETTGIAVLFDDALVAGRDSPGLHGDASPRDGLRILLVGTGLNAHFSSMNAFTVNATPADATELVGAPPPATPELAENDAAELQRAVEQVLCVRRDTRPGSFRLALQIWIDASGHVADVVALAPSDDGERDARVVGAIRRARVPARLAAASPFTVLLAPSRIDACGAA